jgi:hypothetical protein
MSHQLVEEVVESHKDREVKEDQERDAKHMEVPYLATRESTTLSRPMITQGFFPYMQMVEEGRGVNQEQKNEFFKKLLDQNKEGTRNRGAMKTILTEFLQTNPLTFVTTPEPMDAEDWLRDTERKLNTIRCNDEEKVRYATFLLSGPAASWWDNVMLSQPIEHIVSWEEFKNKFRESQVPESILEFKRREFEILQQNYLSVCKYVGEFDRLARYAIEEVNTKAKRIRKFIKGMRPFMRMQLNLAKPTNFKELVNMAITLEEDHKEVLMDRKWKTRSEPQQLEIHRSQPEMTFQTRVRKSISNLPREVTLFHSRIRCHNCARKGHFAKDCMQQDITCFGCGRLGHLKTECPNPDLIQREAIERIEVLNHKGKSLTIRFKRGRKWRARKTT